MDARVALLHLWTVLVLLTAELIDAEVYTNTWAVEINGGPEEASRIARKHGFINLGNVSCCLQNNGRVRVCIVLCLVTISLTAGEDSP